MSIYRASRASKKFIKLWHKCPHSDAGGFIHNTIEWISVYICVGEGERKEEREKEKEGDGKNNEIY